MDATSFVYKRGKTNIEVYLYTEGNTVIPRDADGVYGAKLMKFVAYENFIYYGKFFVKKNMVKRLKSTSFGCKNYGNKDSVGKCIVRFVEAKWNCTTYHLYANQARVPCNEKGDAMSDGLHRDLAVLSEYGIYNLTGCLPPCEHDEIGTESMESLDSPIYEGYHYQKGKAFALEFQFKDGMYLSREEYIVYDTDSLIADVGGYLGLLLGHSMLSIYSSLVEWLPESRNKIGKQLN